ncbi:hypothetical protein Q9S78_02560 [Microbacterium sp. KSW-18]|uniref:Lipoprotein n=1 Tax=Microbacterium aquilitoris TaxID=3067307 RepID=A0ABU3GFS0_9MICO|nr:hypothetical protein [Microbacterium sp. KSW-18]MDT3329543.1 hypothetical protein [Microbacterium sp. KSW-18]
MRRPLLALTALTLSLGLSGCISTTGVDDAAPSPSPSMPVSSAPSPSSTPSPSASPESEEPADPPYDIPVEDPLEASRLVFTGDAVGVEPVTSLNVSASAVRDQEYTLEFDCIPRDATITLSLSPAAGEDEPPVTIKGPLTVTQGCGAPGRLTGITVDRMVGIQITAITDGVDRAWAILRAAD